MDGTYPARSLPPNGPRIEFRELTATRAKAFIFWLAFVNLFASFQTTKTHIRLYLKTVFFFAFSRQNPDTADRRSTSPSDSRGSSAVWRAGHGPHSLYSPATVRKPA
jgi:hypothetical protein